MTGNTMGRVLSLVLQAVESGIWDRPPTQLPDANTWPTWGALRERVLTATTVINILGSATVRDAFVAEVAKLSPPELSKLVSVGAHRVHCICVPWTIVLGPAVTPAGSEAPFGRPRQHSEAFARDTCPAGICAG